MTPIDYPLLFSSLAIDLVLLYLLAYVFFYRRHKRRDVFVAISLINITLYVLGGALGNIYDRATYGFVIDYADLHFGEFRPFLIFNIADAAITFGVLILLARSLLSREKPGSGDTSPTENV